MTRPIFALAGGVGGARMVDGLVQCFGEAVQVIVNTGDDFTHLGFPICPDLDTVMYTLAGVANPEQGWGLAGETTAFLDQMKRLGGPSWFLLGDRDLATHALRREMLGQGMPLSAVTRELCQRLNVTTALMPMSDDAVRTEIESQGKHLAFQDYFVRLRADVPVSGIRFAGAETAQPSAPLRAAMADVREVEAVVICPSNPYLSIDPIMAVPGLRDWLTGIDAPVVAVSPIIAGAAVKGPAARLMADLGADVSALGIARHYRGLIDGLLIDEADAGHAAAIAAEGITAHVAPILMRTREDRARVAQAALDFARGLKRSPARVG